VNDVLIVNDVSKEGVGSSMATTWFAREVNVKMAVSTVLKALQTLLPMETWRPWSTSRSTTSTMRTRQSTHLEQGEGIAGEERREDGTNAKFAFYSQMNENYRNQEKKRHLCNIHKSAKPRAKR